MGDLSSPLNSIDVPFLYMDYRYKEYSQVANRYGLSFDQCLWLEYFTMACLDGLINHTWWRFGGPEANRFSSRSHNTERSLEARSYIVSEHYEYPVELTSFVAEKPERAKRFENRKLGFLTPLGWQVVDELGLIGAVLKRYMFQLNQRKRYISTPEWVDNDNVTIQPKIYGIRETENWIYNDEERANSFDCGYFPPFSVRDMDDNEITGLFYGTLEEARMEAICYLLLNPEAEDLCILNGHSNDCSAPNYDMLDDYMDDSTATLFNDPQTWWDKNVKLTLLALDRRFPNNYRIELPDINFNR